MTEIIFVLLSVVAAVLIFLQMRRRLRRRTRSAPPFAEAAHSRSFAPQQVSSALPGQPRIIPRDAHPVSRREVSQNAQKVLHRLNSSGHNAFLVGGSIRDIYLDKHPKDFDIATDATPEEVRKLFRNSRIIGRRFKLVHILFGRDTIEVATFRADHQPESSVRDANGKQSDSGRILRDNVYGTMDGDAMRRDFTINALYYDIRNFTVVDYCDGVKDIEQQTVRLIGDPAQRYHEDPVRMLRALRFVGKLGFKMEGETGSLIGTLGHLLADIPSARLFDEVLKLLQSGQGVTNFHLLREYGLLQYLFPATDRLLDAEGDTTEPLIVSALRNTDRRIDADKPVTPAFLFAAFLWAPMQQRTDKLVDQGLSPAEAQQQAASEVLSEQCRHTAIPKRFSMVVRDIWGMQHKLVRRQPRHIFSTLDHPKFRAAYDFLLLREACGEQLKDAGAWWTAIQKEDETGQQMMVDKLARRRPQQRRRGRGRSGSGSSSGGGSTS